MRIIRNICNLFTAFLCLSMLMATSARAFEPLKGDLSDYDPNNQTFPTSGDTINVAIWDCFTGSNAYVGEEYWVVLGFVVHDINSQGGIFVDGKKKLIRIIKADTQGKPAPGKAAAERAILRDKVIMFSGVTGSHVSKVGQQTAKRFKTIFMNCSAYADSLMDLPNFNRYVFRTSGTATTSGEALASYFINRPESKFYICAQDYLWGHSFAGAFKKALLKVRPDAKIVGEDYFPQLTKDFAPYLEKIRASRANVVITGAWGADNDNLIKQSRQLGLKNPLNPGMYIQFASPFLDDTRPLETIGGPAGAGLILCSDFYLDRRKPKVKRLATIWNNLWKTWKAPYNTDLYRWPSGTRFRYLVSYYWYFKVLEEAGSTDPEKVTAAWEGNTFDYFDQPMYMRPDDHQTIMDRPISVLEFPNHWDMPDNAAPADPTWIPAKDCMPTFDPKLKGRASR